MAARFSYGHLDHFCRTSKMSHDRGRHTKRLSRDCAGRGRWLWRLVRRRSGSEGGRSQKPSRGCGSPRRRSGSRKNETHREVLPQKVRLPDEAGGRRRSASEAAGFRPEPQTGLEAKTLICRTERSSGALVALLVRYRIYFGPLFNRLRAYLPVTHRYIVERQR